MKKKHYLLMAILICLLGLTISSCSKDDEELVTPHATFTFSTNAQQGNFVSNGDVLQYEIVLDESTSSENLQISKVEYYWDEEWVMTALDSKHKFSWLIENQETGEHVVKMKIYANGDGYTELITILPHTVTVANTIPNDEDTNIVNNQ